MRKNKGILNLALFADRNIPEATDGAIFDGDKSEFGVGANERMAFSGLHKIAEEKYKQGDKRFLIYSYKFPRAAQMASPTPGVHVNLYVDTEQVSTIPLMAVLNNCTKRGWTTSLHFCGCSS